MKSYFVPGLVALLVSLGVIWLAPALVPGAKKLSIAHVNEAAPKGSLFTLNENNEIVPLDFTDVSEKVMDAVVHIKSTQTEDYSSRQPQEYRELPDPFRDFFRDDFFEKFFGPPGQRWYRFESPQPDQPQIRVGTGSGVIINDEGYIVTNNHVISNGMT